MSRQRIVAGALFLLVAAAAGLAASLGLANLYAQTARLQQEHWAAGSRSFREEDLETVMGHIAAGLRGMPGHSWSLEERASLEFLRMRTTGDPQVALGAVRAARNDLRQALRDRPTSPFIWANITLAKLFLNEFDDELFTAMRTANLAGPWEPQVQRAVLFVALAAWPRLDPALREETLQVVRRGALRDANSMVEIGKSYSRLDLLCGINEYESLAREACKRTPM
jgi:hypothetical protein